MRLTELMEILERIIEESDLDDLTIVNAVTQPNYPLRLLVLGVYVASENEIQIVTGSHPDQGSPYGSSSAWEDMEVGS